MVSFILVLRVADVRVQSHSGWAHEIGGPPRVSLPERLEHFLKEERVTPTALAGWISWLERRPVYQKRL